MANYFDSLVQSKRCISSATWLNCTTTSLKLQYIHGVNKKEVFSIVRGDAT
jgi:hypothetical protein